MEIGELVSVAIPELGVDDKCPFSHEKPNPTEKNELGGIGSTLGDNMAVGKGICHESRKGAYLTGSKELDPRKRPKKDKISSVYVKVNGDFATLNDQSGPLPYPLTCAAHHLIPAQESLKGHSILKYMCKKDEDQDFRNGKKAAPASVGGSKVWGNVAYNVNGCHNGVWLPGNYAVGGGVGGAQIWSEKANAKRNGSEANEAWVKALDLAAADWDSGDDDDEEELSDALKRALGRAKKPRYMLAGKNHHIVPGNPKWGYVKAAMDATHAQFHDRHEDYSKQVKKYLSKIAGAYQNMHSRSKSNCEKCEDAARPPKMTSSEVGPPFGIVGRLRAGSNFFKRYLIAPKRKLGRQAGTKTITAANIYTSNWVHAWFEEH